MKLVKSIYCWYLQGIVFITSLLLFLYAFGSTNAQCVAHTWDHYSSACQNNARNIYTENQEDDSKLHKNYKTVFHAENRKNIFEGWSWKRVTHWMQLSNKCIVMYHLHIYSLMLYDGMDILRELDFHYSLQPYLCYSIWLITKAVVYQ